jgi:predicted metal-dependent phosphoesterase TrpH
MVEKLKGMGVSLKIDEIKARAGSGSVGRPHIAEVLVENGYVRDSGEAFVRFIGYHSPAYVPKMEMSPREAFDLVKSVGGISVLAHPGTFGRDDLIPEFAEQGLEGVEVWHSKHDTATSKRLVRIAQRYGLLMTGGSDCHGDRQNGPLLGTVRVPYKVLEALKSARGNVAAV